MLSPKPEIVRTELAEDDSAILVLASDGFFDGISSADASGQIQEFQAQNLTLVQICQQLGRQRACSPEQTDNVTLVLVKISSLLSQQMA